jgi:hypothetical protein
MRTDLSLVTVCGTARRVDLALPNAVPVAEFTAVLAELCGVETDDARPGAWTLARVGAPPLALAATLAQAGVVDGEVLHLVDVADWGRPQVTAADEPVSAAVKAGEADRWAAMRGQVLALFGGAHLLAAAAFAAAVPALRRPAGPALLAAAVALLTTAYFLTGAAGRRAGRLALVSGAGALTAVAGWGLTGGAADAFGLAGGALGVLATALVAAPLIPDLVGGVALAGGMAAAAAGALLAGARPVQVAAAAAVLGVVALRVLPSVLGARLSRRAAGAGPAEIEATARASRTALASLSWGSVAVTVPAVVTLAVAGDGFAGALAVAVGLALLLRARSYRFPREALPPALGAGLTLLAAETAAAVRVFTPHGLAGGGVVLLAASGAGLAALAVRDPGRPVLPWWPGWAMVDACMLPLLLGTLGVFDALAGLLHHVG